jgi:hypothetical protein
MPSWRRGVEAVSTLRPLRKKMVTRKRAILESRHQGGAFVQDGQNRVPGLGRKHQDHSINAGVTVAL